MSRRRESPHPDALAETTGLLVQLVHEGRGLSPAMLDVVREVRAEALLPDERGLTLELSAEVVSRFMKKLAREGDDVQRRVLEHISPSLAKKQYLRALRRRRGMH